MREHRFPSSERGTAVFSWRDSAVAHFKLNLKGPVTGRRKKKRKKKAQQLCGCDCSDWDVWEHRQTVRQNCALLCWKSVRSITMTLISSRCLEGFFFSFLSFPHGVFDKTYVVSVMKYLHGSFLLQQKTGFHYLPWLNAYFTKNFFLSTVVAKMKQ